MGQQYLIDTNIISFYFAETLPDKAMEFLDGIIYDVPNVSIITQIEILSWNTSAALESAIKIFISECNVLNLDENITDSCIRLRRKKSIKTPDAIIAATALANNYTLITANEKDFSNIKGLKVINPHKL